MKLNGGVAPYMMGLIAGIAIVSTLTANQARLLNENAAQEYINNKKEYANKLADSLANSVYDESGTSSSTFTTADAQKYVYTNVFDASSTDAQVAVSADSNGNKKIAISVDSNAYEQNKSANASAIVSNLSDKQTASFVSEKALRDKQVELSYNNMKDQAYSIYNEIITTGAETFLCNPTIKAKDAWNRDFGYEYVDVDKVNLSFTLPWNTAEKRTMSLRLPDVSSKVFEIKEIYGAGATYAVATTGELFVSGHNNFGQLGIGIDDDNDVAGWHKATLSNVDKVYYDNTAYNAYALTKSGDVWVAGKNEYRSLGIGAVANVSTWTKTNLTNIKELYIMPRFAYALTQTGEVWVTGYNSYGQLGMGSTTLYQTWTKHSISNITDIAVSSSSSTYGHAFMIASDGKLYATGYCSNHTCLGLGNGTKRDRFTFVMSNVQKVWTNYASSYVLNTSDELYVAGSSYYGNLGIGTTGSSDYFTKVSQFTGVKDLYIKESTVFAILNDSRLFATGDNRKGLLATGNEKELTWFNTNRTGILNIVFQKFRHKISSSTYDDYEYAYFLDSTGYIYRNGGKGQTGGDTWRKSGDNGYVRVVPAYKRAYGIKPSGNMSVIGIGKSPDLGYSATSETFYYSFRSVTSTDPYRYILGVEGYNGLHYYLKDNEGLLYTLTNDKTLVEFKGVSCPSGYTDNDDGTCTISVTEPATQSCPSGYTNNGSVCTKTSYTSASYVCSSGSVSGSSCYVYTSATKVCPSGYTESTYNSSQCYQTSTVHDPPCQSGYTLTPGNRCARYTNKVDSCPSGYSIYTSGMCRKYTGSAYYSCPSGYTLSGNTCYRTLTTSITYSCSTGSLSGTDCIDSETIPKPGIC